MQSSSSLLNAYRGTSQHLEFDPKAAEKAPLFLLSNGISMEPPANQENIPMFHSNGVGFYYQNNFGNTNYNSSKVFETSNIGMNLDTSNAKRPSFGDNGNNISGNMNSNANNNNNDQLFHMSIPFVLFLLLQIFTSITYVCLKKKKKKKNDPFLLYMLTVSETEFHQLKTDQTLLVDFNGFPKSLIYLLQECLKCKQDEHPKLIAFYTARNAYTY
ncbi:spindle assembly protein, partial [Reticulomyxa filosa]